MGSVTAIAVNTDKITDTITSYADLFDAKYAGDIVMCVASCPGQAIFLVNEEAAEDYATVTLPYEFLPVPTAGTRGRGLSRSGEEICDAVVESVRCVSAFDHTNLLTMRVPEDCAMEKQPVPFSRLGDEGGQLARGERRHEHPRQVDEGEAQHEDGHGEHRLPRDASEQRGRHHGHRE